MHHQDGRAGLELDGEVAVRDRVQGVLRRPVEAQQLRRAMAVDGVGGPGQRRRAQGHDVDAATAVSEALTVALEHLDPGHHVVPEGDRLRDLEVCESRHDGLGLALGQIQQGQLQALAPGPDGVDLVAQVEPDVGGHLVVAGAPRVQLFAGVADVRGQRGLDVHVDVFQWDGPVEHAGLDALAYPLQTRDDGIALVLGQNAPARQHRWHGRWSPGYRSGTGVGRIPPRR